MNPRPIKNIHEPISLSFGSVVEKIANEEIPVNISLQTKPFLKWVGGKRSVLSELENRMPSEFVEYHEPFIGGGALYFSLQPSKAFISDVNLHLIVTYSAVRDDVEGLIKELEKHRKNHEKEYYLKMRKRLSSETEPTKIAGIVIYLNKTCFNGLYRVNKSGEFNVPMGNYEKPPILDEDTLRADSSILKGVKIEQKGFKHIKPKRNAFYYMDPPYHKTYSQYDGSGFGEDEHKELSDFCKAIDKIGGYFMVSNSDTELVKALYKKYNIEEVMASRSVSCKSHQRGQENELIIRNYK